VPGGRLPARRLRIGPHRPPYFEAILSFLDEPDEPARPRRRPATGPGVDRQTLLVRRTIAAGAGLLVLILLVVGVRSCLDSRKERAMKEYVSEVDAQVRETQQLSTALFELLGSGAGGEQDQAVDTQNSLNGYRSQMALLVDRARELDPPGDLDSAQSDFVETQQFRADGLSEIARHIDSAISEEQRQEGTRQVAADMQLFLASDVIYFRRFIPELEDTLGEQGIADQVRIPRSTFLTDIDWLQPSFVADSVSGLRTGEDATAAPGLHGNGIAAATIGGQALSPDGSVTVQLTDDVTVEVQVANQGEHPESDVPVTVTIGSGDDAIDLEETIDEIQPGETQTVTLPLGEQPPTGQNVPIRIEVEKVPGEEKLDNNELEATAIFTR
jgi:hypothetical protein